jgi:hypothetical protein
LIERFLPHSMPVGTIIIAHPFAFMADDWITSF